MLTWSPTQTFHGPLPIKISFHIVEHLYTYASVISGPIKSSAFFSITREGPHHELKTFRTGVHNLRPQKDSFAAVKL